jgi:long-subunit fatty acid transport protein
MHSSKTAAWLLVGAMISSRLWATNAMNLEGYGSIASAMGGASQAYDVGVAASMSNPATIGLMKQGGFLLSYNGMLPSVSATNKKVDSSTYGDVAEAGGLFNMPGMGFVSRGETFSFGLTMLAQGGMGAEYKKDSFLGNPNDLSDNKYPLVNQSELGVMRIVAPVAIELFPGFFLGGSVDWVLAMMDIKWAMSEGQFEDLTGFNKSSIYDNSTSTHIKGSASHQLGSVEGNLIDTFRLMYGPLGGMAAVSTVNYAYFDFADDSPWTQNAKGWGMAGKVGFVYKPNAQFSMGGSYHTKTAMSDLRTDSPLSPTDPHRHGATMKMGIKMPILGSIGDIVNNNALVNLAENNSDLINVGLDFLTDFISGLNGGNDGGSDNGGSNLDVGAILGSALLTGDGNVEIPITGTITVHDFQWPETVAFGLAYSPVDDLMLVFDYKFVAWSGVMESFKMTFVADPATEQNTTSNDTLTACGASLQSADNKAMEDCLAKLFADLPGILDGSTEMRAELFQKWNNQHVVAMGAQYSLTDELDLRVGYNYGTNPVPEYYLQPLFPAIVQEHFTAGFGYAPDGETFSVDMSYSYVPEASLTSSSLSPVKSAMSQHNFSINYTSIFED